jgi:hypothetical protein
MQLEPIMPYTHVSDEHDREYSSDRRSGGGKADVASDTDPASTGLAGSLALTTEEEVVLRAVLDALRRIQHGSVQLVVQDSHVVQIDTVEKNRLARSARIRNSA